jgi:hypothetical protein
MNGETEKVPDTLAAGIKATGGQGEDGARDGTLSGPPAAVSMPPASGEHEGGEVREGSGILPFLGGIGEGLGREPAPRPEPATQSRDTRDTLALADVAAMDESARAYYANLGKMAVDRIEEVLDDGLLNGGPKDHVANVAYLIPDGLDALIALARRNRGGGTGDEATETIERLRAERDALMALIVQPWARDGDGVQLWKVNLAWWETATSREEGVAMVRKAAGLEAKP